MFPKQSYSPANNSGAARPDFEKLLSAIIVIAMCLNVSAVIVFILAGSSNEKTTPHYVVANSGKKVMQ